MPRNQADSPYWPPDLSRPAPEALKLIQSRPKCEIGTNDSHWLAQINTPLSKPPCPMIEQGTITLRVDAYNGTKQRPNMQQNIYSQTTSIGGHSWRMRLVPKGTTTVPHPKLFIENTTLPQMTPDAWSNEELMLPTTDDKSITKSPYVAARFGVVAYNPSNPEVYIFKQDRYLFSRDSPDRGWERFTGQAWFELHVREYYQVAPLLQSDTLVFKAYIQVLDDRSRSLWSSKPTDHIRDIIDRTGHLPLPLCGSTSAVVSLLLYNVHFRRLLYNVSAHITDVSLATPSTQILFDLVQLLYNLRSRQIANNAQLLSALRRRLHGITKVDLKLSSSYHGTDDGDAIDVVQTLQAMEAALELGIKSLFRSAKGSAGMQKSLGYMEDVQQLLPIRLQVDGPTNMQALVNLQYDMQQSPWKFFEIKRHAFDAANRCWTRRSDKVTLTSEISYAAGRYVLQGVITHKGHLNTGHYTPYIRNMGTPDLWLTTSGDNAVFEPASRVNDTLCGTGQRIISPHPRNWADHPAREFYELLSMPEEVAHVICYQRVDDTGSERNARDICERWSPPSWALWTYVSPSDDDAGQINAIRLCPDEGDSMSVHENHEHSPEAPDSEDSDTSMTMDEDDAEFCDVPVVTMAGTGDCSSTSTDITLKTDQSKQGQDVVKDFITRHVKIDFLSQPFYDGEMYRSMYHGTGHLINMEGDEYSGAFVQGRYDGWGKLTMCFGDKYNGSFTKGLYEGHGELSRANGDRYVGGFHQGKYHGSGMLVEKSTGNIYDGGWRKGKQHGKGTTYWKSSDEQRRLCKICETKRADHVFFDCGHVVACKNCAFQLNECPVCRKEIIDVMKIFLV